MNKYYTYISRKQIGVIFANWKRGNLDLDKKVIDFLYKECAEVKGFNFNANMENVLQIVKKAIEAIFSGNMEEANSDIIRAYESFNVYFA